MTTLGAAGLIAAVFGFGCGGGSSSSMPDGSSGPMCPSPVTLTTVQTDIFSPTCVRPSCHGAAPFGAGLDLNQGNAYKDLVNVTATFSPMKKRVVPGSPETSFLWDKVTGNLSSGEGIRMPNGGTPLPQQQLNEIYCWIKGGAQNN